MNKRIQKHIKLNVNHLYEFTLYNTYRGLFGAISLTAIVFSIALLVTGINEEGLIKKLLLLLVLVVFAGLIPYLMYKQAEVYLKNSPIYKDGILFEIDDNEILVRLEEEVVSNPWNEVYKVVETTKSFYLYTRQLGGIILPKDYIGEDYNLLRQYIVRNVNSAHYKLK